MENVHGSVFCLLADSDSKAGMKDTWKCDRRDIEKKKRVFHSFICKFILSEVIKQEKIFPS